jgi:hypothetical protein
MSLEIYRKKGTTKVFKLRAISIDGKAVASLAGLNVKMVIKVPHKRLAVDYEPVTVGEPGSKWRNTQTDTEVELVRVTGRGVYVKGTKRGRTTERLLDFGEWGAHYEALTWTADDAYDRYMASTDCEAAQKETAGNGPVAPPPPEPIRTFPPALYIHWSIGNTP